MHRERSLAASATLDKALDALMELSPPELLFLGPIFQEAITHTRVLAANAPDAETKLVADATRENLQRLLAERQTFVAQPLAWSDEIRALLHSCVAGKDSLPA